MPRPASITFLVLLVLGLAAYNALGAYAAIQGYTVLRELPLSLPPAYLVGRGAVWALVFAVLSAGLWRLKHWGRLGTPSALSIYLALGWVERLVFAGSDYARSSALFFLALHGVCLAVVWAWLLRRPIRQSFTE
jgi:hypothetical protein